VKVIIAGSRDLDYPEIVREAIDKSGWRFQIEEVVHGGCRGVDMCAGAWAAEEKIPVRVFPAEWGKHGLRAGPIRNAQMADYADALIAVWDGVSKGTKNMIAEANARMLKVYVYRYPSDYLAHPQQSV